MTTTHTQTEINQTLVCRIGLAKVKTAEQYWEIANNANVQHLKKAWLELSEPERQNIEILVCTDKIKKSTSQFDLDALKEEYSEEVYSRSLNTLSEEERELIFGVSKPVQSGVIDVNSMTLEQLSFTAKTLWMQLEDGEGDVETIVDQLLECEIAEARKVDAIVWVCEQYDADILADEARLAEIVRIHTVQIERKKKKVQALKDSLVFRNGANSLEDKLIGNERTISFRDNPPRVHWLVSPNSTQFPDRYREVVTKYKLLPELVLEDAKNKIDVSSVAEIKIGRHVRFGKNIEPKERTVKAKKTKVKK